MVNIKSLPIDEYIVQCRTILAFVLVIYMFIVEATEMYSSKPPKPGAMLVAPTDNFSEPD